MLTWEYSEIMSPLQTKNCLHMNIISLKLNASNYHFMEKNKAIEYLYQLNELGWKLGLNKIKALLREIGNPHLKYKTIHVAGTNGKGSVCAILDSILKTAGYRTGLYTSPHLIDICERIRYQEKCITQDVLIYHIKKLRPLIEKYKCTFFEAMTAIAFDYFADQGVDVAVIEVGLGGRLDATNVVNPILTIITDIEHDHVQQLGGSREKIAFEKGGIIKKGIKCLTISRYRSVIDTLSKICLERKAELIQVAKFMHLNQILQNDKFSSFDLKVNGSVYPRLKTPLIGAHQIENAVLAVSAANILSSEHLKIRIEDIYQGLFEVQWPGRMQIIQQNPKCIVDVAHNPDGIKETLKAIGSLFAYNKLIVVLGILKNKNYNSMVRMIATMADQIIAVKPDSDRALDPTYIVKAARSFGIQALQVDSAKDGMNYAISHASCDDLILGTGSHHTVGEILNSNKNA